MSDQHSVSGTPASLERLDLADFTHSIHLSARRLSCAVCNAFGVTFHRGLYPMKFFRPISTWLSPVDSVFFADGVYARGPNAAGEDEVEIELCSLCLRYLRKSKSPPGAKPNIILGPPAPDWFASLTWIEWRLIALVVPFQVIYSLSGGGQFATRGHVTNMWAKPSVLQLARKLPRTAAEADIIYIQYATEPRPTRRLPCRPALLERALIELKRRNPLYAEIEIAQDVLRDMAARELDNRDDPSLVTLDLSGGPAENGDRVPDILYFNEHEHKWTTDDIKSGLQRQLDLEPLVPLAQVLQRESVKVLCCAFPRLYPNGTGDFVEERPTSLGVVQYYRQLLRRLSSDFRQDPGFLFFAYQHIQTVQMESSIQFMLRNRPAVAAESDPPLQLAAVQHAASSGQWTGPILQDITLFASPVRGTDPYWIHQQRDVVGLVQHLPESPTLFLTFSAADTHWPSLCSFLRVPHPTDLERVTLLAHHPVEAAVLFYKRWQAMERHILHGRRRPLGDIVDHWWRVEFQKRGSPHIHMLAWIRGGAPQEADDLTRWLAGRIQADVPAFSQEEIERAKGDNNAQHPSRTEADSQYTLDDRQGAYDSLRLLTATQYHVCDVTGNCKVTKSTQALRVAARHSCSVEEAFSRCRSGFPRPLRQEMKVKIVNSDETEGAPVRWVFPEPPRRDAFINDTNLMCLRAWRANLDIQLINRAVGAAVYIAAYSSKGEPRDGSLGGTLRALERNSNIPSYREKVRAVADAILTSRIVSAQEAAWTILGLPFISSSRVVLRVCVRPKAERSRRIRKVTNWDTADSSAVAPDWADRYRLRAASLEECRAYEFLRQYYRPHAADLSHPRPAAEEYIVIPYPKMPVDLNEPSFAYSMLLLHTAWRNEAELVPPGQSAVSILSARMETDPELLRCVRQYVANAQEADQLQEIERKEAQQVAESAEEERKAVTHVLAEGDAEEASSQNASQHLPLSLLNIPPAGILSPSILLERDHMDQEYARARVWLSEAKQNYRARQREELQRRPDPDDSAVTDWTVVEGIECRRSVAERVGNLTTEQRNVFIRVARLLQLQKHRNWLDLLACGQVQNVVVACGKAGTGKSYLLQTLRQHVLDEYRREIRPMALDATTHTRGPVVAAAYTGVAAALICGGTLHEIFKIPAGVHRKEASAGEVHTLSVELSELKLLVVDEIGMLPDYLFQAMDHRLNQVKSRNSRGIHFGGVVILLTGDFRQLPPVGGAALYNAVEKTLWQSFEQVQLLTVAMRQDTDPNFVQMLDRCAASEAIWQDIEMLRTRAESASRTRIDAPWNDALWLSYRNRQVHHDNRARLQALSIRTNQPIVNIFRKHVPTMTANRHHTEQERDRRKYFYKSPAGPTRSRGEAKDAEKQAALVSLCVGAQVSITENIAVELGIANGAVGAVHEILIPATFQNHSSLETLLQWDQDAPLPIILVKLEPEFARQGVSFDAHVPRIVPILPTKHLTGPGGPRCYGEQLPLRLSFASTIHKAQGRTLPQAVVNLQGIRTRALAYTALSRVRKLEDLLIRRTDWSLSTLNAGRDTREHNLLHNELERLKRMSELFAQNFRRQDNELKVLIASEPREEVLVTAAGQDSNEPTAGRNEVVLNQTLLMRDRENKDEKAESSGSSEGSNPAQEEAKKDRTPRGKRERNEESPNREVRARAEARHKKIHPRQEEIAVVEEYVGQEAKRQRESRATVLHKLGKKAKTSETVIKKVLQGTRPITQPSWDRLLKTIHSKSKK